jgi:hypothetical protein
MALTPAQRQEWEAAFTRISQAYTDAGVPEHMRPTRPPRWETAPRLADDANAWMARKMGDMRGVVNKAKRQGVWVNVQAEDQQLNEQQQEWWDALPAWMQAMVDMQGANAAAGGLQGAAQWKAMGDNPALWQEMRAREMGPFADFFWNQFPQQMNAIGDTIGAQLNMNAQRVSAMTMARGEDDRKRDALRDTLAALKDIYGGFSGALGSGLGSIGEGLGQWGQGFSPLGGASGAFGAGGGGGWRILPNGSVVTAQDVPEGIPVPGEIRGGEVNLGAVAGVDPRAAQELAEAGRGAGRQAAGRIRGKFNADAARQQMAAQGALMGQGAKANAAQLQNALLTSRGTNKNILANAQANAVVQKAQNQARAARGKQMSGLVGQLGGMLGGALGNIG